MNHLVQRLFITLGLAFLLDRTNGCYIGQVDSGECVKARYVLEGKLEFCGQGYSWFELHPDYEVCVPMETADGRSAGLTVQNKDEWVKETYERILEERMIIEKEYEDRSVNELGIPGETAQRFRGNSDCQNAYVSKKIPLNQTSITQSNVQTTDTKTSSAGQTFRDVTRRERA